MILHAGIYTHTFPNAQHTAKSGKKWEELMVRSIPKSPISKHGHDHVSKIFI